MDYRIRRKASELDSTGFMEVGPGRYEGKHWQDGFLFVWEDAFGMAEGILAKHLPQYDHFGVNEVPQAVGLAVITDWRCVADRLSEMGLAEAHLALNLNASYRERLDEEVAAHRQEIADLLRDLADECEGFYHASSWMCVLGV